MIQFGSVVPEREGLPFYIIAIKWFTRWQRYTGCLKIDDSEDEGSGLPTKDKSKIILGPHPGFINQMPDIKDLCIKSDNLFVPDDDMYRHFYIKSGKKEDQDFKVVDQEVWQKLS